MEEGKERDPEKMETLEEQAQVAEELRQLGQELRLVMTDEGDVTARMKAVVRRADQAGTARENIIGLMAITDHREALAFARKILRGIRRTPRAGS